MNTNQHQQKFRVALVNPLGMKHTQMPLPPFGLGSMAKFYRIHGLNREHVEIRIFDENVRKRQTQNDILEWKPKLIGIGTMSLTLSRATELALFLRSHIPDAFILGGGVHFQIRPDDGLKLGIFDAVCTSEGEEPLRALIDLYCLGTRERTTLHHVPNLAWRDADGTPQKSMPWQLEDLDAMPLPDVADFDTRYYFAKRQFIPGVWAKSASILSSRGCPFQCTFCFNSFHRGRVRYHSLDAVISQIILLRDRYGIRHICIAEDLFFMKRDRVRNFCERLLQTEANIHWTCNVRPSVLQETDHELLALMKRSGCIQIACGFESGSNEVLAKLKGHDATVIKNQRAIDMANKAGIRVFGYFMCGIPDETEEQMMQTVSFIERNFDKLSHFEYFIYTPFPGAELSREVERQGLLEGVDIEDLALSIFSQGTPRVFNRLVSAEKVLQIRRDLKRRVMEKYSWSKKIHWLISEGLDNPLRTVRRISETYSFKRGHNKHFKAIAPTEQNSMDTR